MKITLRLDTANDAFAEGEELEIARILRAVADRAESGELHAGALLPLRDVNGNKVGLVTVS
jgi:hypothetical protein